MSIEKRNSYIVDMTGGRKYATKDIQNKKFFVFFHRTSTFFYKLYDEMLNDKNILLVVVSFQNYIFDNRWLTHLCSFEYKKK